ncbi:MAG: alkaline phosphatase family protein, partial [Verrucomicrobiota bacterium]|nr:alkaline phosphatase family protein [Verrucomicrobiota bacterium]
MKTCSASRWVCCLALLITTIPLLGEDAQPAKPARNVVLIGWDGAQREHVFECLERGELPNLKKLAAEGGMTNIHVVGVTDTKAGWAEILTGYGPKNTGVYSNGKFQPIPSGYTIFERFRRQFGGDKVATVAVIGKDHHVGGNAPPRKVKLEEEAVDKDGDDDSHDIGAADNDKAKKRENKRVRDEKNGKKKVTTQVPARSGRAPEGIG